jgi:hypothetical protein
LGRDEKVKQWNQRLADGSREGLFLKLFELVMALSIHEPRPRFSCDLSIGRSGGTEFLMSERDGNVPVGALSRREYRHIHPKTTSVEDKVRMY